MITLNTLKITTLAVVTALSLNACKSTSNTQQTAESRVSITDGNVRAEAYLNDVGRKIRMAITNGEMTEEEGRVKYAATVQRVEKRMAGAKGTDADGERKLAQENYDRAADKMTEMVKAGEITREQMEARLNRMKKAMASKEERSDECIELRKKLGEAVRSGEMTREEAGKIWEEEGC